MEKENWVIISISEDYKAIGRRFGIDQVTARIIRNRGVVGDEAMDQYLHGNMSDLGDPFLLQDMEKASSLIRKKIAEGASVRVIGDYDIDGIMSAYLLKRGLLSLGAHADAVIPERILDGYGISDRLVEQARADGIDTLITCDNGIAASAQIRRAKEYGMTVIVTDHHSIPKEGAGLPAADAVIDPKREENHFPNREICGAGLAWELLKALDCPEAEDLIQYAAFATVGDIVELKGENRILAKEGIARLRRSSNLGLQALAKASGMNLMDIDAYRIGYVLGPCLNATGRLDSAMTALHLLESADEEEAERLASELADLNAQRKGITEEGFAEALSCLKKEESGGRIHVIYLPECHESVAGIVAGRIREKTGHPTFIVTNAMDGSGLKGSGRSTENYDMFDGISGCSDLLTKFGGHKMAAGISLKKENLAAFRERLNENCTLGDDDFIPKVRIDAAMPIGYVTPALIDELKLLEPCGKGNEKPVFVMKDLTVRRFRLVGRTLSTLKIDGEVYDERLKRRLPVQAVCFRDAELLKQRVSENPKIDAVYYPSVNEYGQMRNIEMVITHFR